MRCELADSCSQSAKPMQMTACLDSVCCKMLSLYFCVHRLRVKDINDAIKELGHMISVHTGSSQPMTRLMIVQEAVAVITGLEQRLRGMLWHGRCLSLSVAGCCTWPYCFACHLWLYSCMSQLLCFTISCMTDTF